MFPFYEQFQRNLGVVSRDISLHFLSVVAIEFKEEQRKWLTSNVVNCRKRDEVGAEERVKLLRMRVLNEHLRVD